MGDPRSGFITGLGRAGISRRGFLKGCAALAAACGLGAAEAPRLAAALAEARRQSVVWLSFQECTGCTESLTRAAEPTLEQFLLRYLSLDYHHTLQAASGEAAEAARRAALAAARGSGLLVVDGTVPEGFAGAACTIAGESALTLLRECMAAAKWVVAVGSCAAFGGLPAARPDPTGARSVAELMAAGKVPRRTLVNVPGCPPVPEVMAGVLAWLLAHGSPPPLDDLQRPLLYYGETVHDRCARLPHYRAGRFAQRFDDEGARRGWCLRDLGCRGPQTHNACSRLRWNLDTANPMEAGHPCIGCAEPGFWDRDGFYERVAASGATGGRDLYMQQCAGCHGSEPAFRTAPERIPDLLDSGAVRAHRFELDAESQAALKDYLQQFR